METIIKRACGLDVHKKRLTACIMVEGKGRKIPSFVFKLKA